MKTTQGINPCRAFIYIPKFCTISVIFSVFGSYTLVAVLHWWQVKFGMEELTKCPLLHAKFHPHLCNRSALRGEKPQNCPLSNAQVIKSNNKHARFNYVMCISKTLYYINVLLITNCSVIHWLNKNIKKQLWHTYVYAYMCVENKWLHHMKSDAFARSWYIG